MSAGPHQPFAATRWCRGEAHGGRTPPFGDLFDQLSKLAALTVPGPSTVHPIGPTLRAGRSAARRGTPETDPVSRWRRATGLRYDPAAMPGFPQVFRDPRGDDFRIGDHSLEACNPQCSGRPSSTGHRNPSARTTPLVPIVGQSPPSVGQTAIPARRKSDTGRHNHNVWRPRLPILLYCNHS